MSILNKPLRGAPRAVLTIAFVIVIVGGLPTLGFWWPRSLRGFEPPDELGFSLSHLLLAYFKPCVVPMIVAAGVAAVVCGPRTCVRAVQRVLGGGDGSDREAARALRVFHHASLMTLGALTLFSLLVMTLVIDASRGQGGVRPSLVAEIMHFPLLGPIAILTCAALLAAPAADATDPAGSGPTNAAGLALLFFLVPPILVVASMFLKFNTIG